MRVLEVAAVDAARFHARFSARERKYVYRLVTGRRCVRPVVVCKGLCGRWGVWGMFSIFIWIHIHPPPPASSALEAGRAWCVGHPLDVPSMERAAEALLGKHDFSSFRGRDCQAKYGCAPLVSSLSRACMHIPSKSG